MQKRTIIYLFCGILAACAHRTETQSATTEINLTDTAARQTPPPAEELPLPQIPVTLQQPTERANYIVEHFWDAMNFKDTLRSHSADFIEQNFVNYISLFPYAETASLQSSVRLLLKSAETDSMAYVKLIETAEKYLYEPNSPMMSEEFYQLFLEHIVQSSVTGDTRIRYRYQLEAVNQNRPGTQAANFTYITPDGNRTTLLNTPVQESLLLFFYDPECDHCKEIMSELQNYEPLNRAIESGKLKVLAIYADGNRPLWEETVSSLPQHWTAGFDTGAIQSKQLYILRAMPSLYLLDNNKQVILKDVLPDQLLKWLQQL